MLTHEEIVQRYKEIRTAAKKVFEKKYSSYGASWAVYRLESMCDQIWIKAKRIRRLEETEALIEDSRENEYTAMINYSLVFLMKIFETDVIPPSGDIVRDTELIDKIDGRKVSELYDLYFDKCFELYEKKNHDYNDAWQDMSAASITDFIITKILRMRHLLRVNETNELDQQLYDIIIYSIFALIKLAR